MVDVETGLKYPFRGDGALKTLGIGGGAPILLYVLALVVAFASLAVPPLGLLNVALLPLQLAVGILWTGYFVRVARVTLDGETTPPSFGDWGDLLRDGLGGVAIVLVYYVPLLVVTLVGYVAILVGVIGLGSGLEGGSDQAAMAAGLVGTGAMLLVVLAVSLLSLAVMYVLPISLVAYAAEDGIGAAFSLDTLLTVGRSSEYVKPWAATFGVYVLLSTVLGLLSIVFVGLVLQPFAYFYVALAGFHMFAQGYASATGMTEPAGTSRDGPTTDPAGGAPRRAPEDV